MSVLCTAATALSAMATESTEREVGELRGDLAALRSFYTRPSDLKNGNHIFDMWAGRSLPRLLQAAGLTNNRALIVNAHGKGVATTLGLRYAYHPHESVVKRMSESAYFTIGDIAAVVGPRSAATIHNVILAGCDRERAFRWAEVRQHFPHATNIVHVPAGAEGYQPMFLQSLVSESDSIAPVYQLRRVNPFGRSRYEIGPRWQQGATRLSPYIAELFRAGERKPFRVQTAGRELLATGPALSTRALVLDGVAVLQLANANKAGALSEPASEFRVQQVTGATIKQSLTGAAGNLDQVHEDRAPIGECDDL